ncbi:hypothetical protein DKY63_30200 [Pseudomonas putida]|uniref:Uncharacterized protein n=1 Tax=Pseudomonas putida TaxID=303 RepID=A0A2Z4RS02_PSEPU|nr:hypothetical protein DKY63_30200 [Pseudomonas putida]
MVVNDNAGSLTPRGVLACIASMLAPTEKCLHLRLSGYGLSVRIVRQEPLYSPSVFPAAPPTRGRPGFAGRGDFL